MRKRGVEWVFSSVYPPLCSGTEEQTKICWHLITKTLGHKRRTIRDKEADRRERGVHWIYVYVPAHAGFIWRRVVGGVKAWKQVPIVQLGVMREVIRVRVSRAGPHGPQSSHWACTRETFKTTTQVPTMDYLKILEFNILKVQEFYKCQNFVKL